MLPGPNYNILYIIYTYDTKGGLTLKYRFTDKEIKHILDNMVVLIDTREQANQHIIDFLNSKKRKYKVMKLDYGDYSCMLPQGTFEGQKRDIYFTDQIVIERKFCIDELAMNFKDKIVNINQVTQDIINLVGKDYLVKILKCDYNRLKSELKSLNMYGVNFFIYIENINFDNDIRLKNYRSEYEPATLYARIKSLEGEFRTLIRPVDPTNAGSEIYNTLRFRVRDILDKRGLIEYD